MRVGHVIRVDHQVAVGADDVAHRAHPCGILAPAFGAVADHHLQALRAGLDLQLGRFFELIQIVLRESEGHVHLGVIPMAAAELRNGAAFFFAADIPTCDIDGGKRRGHHAGHGAVVHFPPHLVVDAFGFARIQPDQHILEVLVDRSDGGAPEIGAAADAVAFNASSVSTSQNTKLRETVGFSNTGTSTVRLWNDALISVIFMVRVPPRLRIGLKAT